MVNQWGNSFPETKDYKKMEGLRSYDGLRIIHEWGEGTVDETKDKVSRREFRSPFRRQSRFPTLCAQRRPPDGP